MRNICEHSVRKFLDLLPRPRSKKLICLSRIESMKASSLAPTDMMTTIADGDWDNEYVGGEEKIARW